MNFLVSSLSALDIMKSSSSPSTYHFSIGMDMFGEINLTGLASVILFYLLILGVIILIGYYTNYDNFSYLITIRVNLYDDEMMIL